MQKLKAFLNLNYYTSELDDFLAKFDKSHHKLSASQRKEVEKYTKIYNLRDNPQPPEENQHFWNEF